MSNLLSLIIDPGGIATVRDGINLRVFPDGDTPLKTEQTPTTAQRTANSSLLANTSQQRYKLSCQFTLEQPQFNQLKALYDYNLAASNSLIPFETVIYNLVEPFTELSPTRTRFRVPDTENISANITSTDLIEYTYWIALQGIFNMTWNQKGRLFEVNFNFEEGTKLTSSMEA